MKSFRTILFCLSCGFALLFPPLGAISSSDVFHVVLDAGHDPSDPGIHVGALVEKDLTLLLVQATAAKLREFPGIDVVLTRKGDYPLSLDERRRVANTHEPGIFLSFHFGGGPLPTPTAPKIFILNGVRTADGGRFVPLEQAHLERSPDSLTFAGLLQEELTPSFPKPTTEVSYLGLASIMGIIRPALLIEAGSLNAPDAARWNEPSVQELFADSVTRAIDRFRNEGKNPSP